MRPTVKNQPLCCFFFRTHPHTHTHTHTYPRILAYTHIHTHLSSIVYSFPLFSFLPLLSSADPLASPPLSLKRLLRIISLRLLSSQSCNPCALLSSQSHDPSAAQVHSFPFFLSFFLSLLFFVSFSLSLSLSLPPFPFQTALCADGGGGAEADAAAADAPQQQRKRRRPGKAHPHCREPQLAAPHCAAARSGLLLLLRRRTGEALSGLLQSFDWGCSERERERRRESQREEGREGEQGLRKDLLLLLQRCTDEALLATSEPLSVSNRAAAKARKKSEDCERESGELFKGLLLLLKRRNGEALLVSAGPFPSSHGLWCRKGR